MRSQRLNSGVVLLRIIYMELSSIVIIWLIFFGIIGIIFLLMIRDTVRRKGRWGINLEKIQCPHCGAQPPI